jgi:hypothetical protein
MSFARDRVAHFDTPCGHSGYGHDHPNGFVQKCADRTFSGALQTLTLLKHNEKEHLISGLAEVRLPPLTYSLLAVPFKKQVESVTDPIPVMGAEPPGPAVQAASMNRLILEKAVCEGREGLG